jgi:sigma-E factor negative regulatory protein RseB
MKSKLAVVLLTVALPLQLVAASGLESVQAWLEKMHQAAHTLNYDGTFVYGQQNQLSTMRIIHSVSETGERERLISMDDTGREVIRDGDTVTCILPDSQSVMVEKSRPEATFPPTFPMKVGQLSQYYELSMAGKSKVAGKPTQKILITPRDNLRYGHALWVDEKTGLLLKTHLLNEQGEPVEQFMFTQITFLAEVPDELLEPGVVGKNFTWYEVKDDDPNLTTNKESPWQVTALPPGFKQDMKRMHRMPTSIMPVEHRVYSDGLASVSVFIERNDDEDKDNLFGGSHMGAVNAHGRNLNGYHVTVVGEVPQAAVRMIGESVQFKARP